MTYVMVLWLVGTNQLAVLSSIFPSLEQCEEAWTLMSVEINKMHPEIKMLHACVKQEES